MVVLIFSHLFSFLFFNYFLHKINITIIWVVENIEICAMSELAIVFGMAMSGDSCSAMFIGEDSFVTQELKHLKKSAKENF